MGDFSVTTFNTSLGVNKNTTDLISSKLARAKAKGKNFCETFLGPVAFLSCFQRGRSRVLCVLLKDSHFNTALVSAKFMCGYFEPSNNLKKNPKTFSIPRRKSNSKAEQIQTFKFDVYFSTQMTKTKLASQPSQV